MPFAVPVRGDGPVAVGLVGLGVIGQVHQEVLRRESRVSLTFAAALPAPGDAGVQGLRRYDALEDALRAIETGQLRSPDLVVLATPTPQHLDHVAEVLARTDAAVLCEKPLTSDTDALDRFDRDFPEAITRLAVVNHFGFSPEVTWGAEVASTRGWGPPSTATASFNDPYVLKSPEQRAGYVSSWVDSGPNQLAVLRRFTGRPTVLQHASDSGGARSVTRTEHEGGTATLVSNWLTGSSSKQTLLRWEAGHELVLDHTAMTGLALEASRPLEQLGNDGTVDRKIAHYTAMYDALLSGATELLSVAFAREVAAVLHTALEAPPVSPPVRWVP
jgi:predicted dehydrogenase